MKREPGTQAAALGAQRAAGCCCPPTAAGNSDEEARTRRMNAIPRFFWEQKMIQTSDTV